MNSSLKHFFQILESVYSVISKLEIPSKLKARLTDYFLSGNQVFFHQKDWVNFLQLIPPSLRTEINETLFRESVARN